MSRGGSDYTPARISLLESNIFGSDPSHTHVFTGSVIISGSLTVVSGAVSPGIHASTHISAGADEIDGDQLDIDFLPTYYIPDTSPAIVTSTGHLTAHLAGIDNALSSSNVAGGDLSGTLPNPTVVGIQGTPVDDTAPTDGQLLVYNSSSAEWVPTTLSSLNVFGTHYTAHESGSMFSTTSVDFQMAARYKIDNIPAGIYRFQWFYIWSHDSVTNNFNVRIQIDDSIDLLIPEHFQEPSDAGGTGPGGTDQRFMVTGYATASLSSGSHWFDIDVRTTKNNKESAIHSSRVEYWRIS